MCPTHVGEHPLAVALSDRERLAHAASALKADGRVHLPAFLSEPAARSLLDALTVEDWILVLTGASGRREIPTRDLYLWPQQEKAALLGAAYQQARTGFQCLYEANRLGGDYETGRIRPGALSAYFEALNSDEVLAGLRRLTGDDRIAYVDATATRFGPGHFLTTHSDHVEGENRLYAYVLNLAPQWRADWGGLLMFHNEAGHVDEAYCPKWGALNVFSVPQPHSVSVVSPFAGGYRYAISGWMRSAAPPGSRFSKTSKLD